VWFGALPAAEREKLAPWLNARLQEARAQALAQTQVQQDWIFKEFGLEKPANRDEMPF
jgi:hypothetical protein